MQKTIWLFGGIAGVLSALLEYLFYSGQNFNSQSLYLSKIILLAICVIFGLILIKKLLGGIISIGRTILSGIMISVVKSIIAIAVFLVLYAPSGEFYAKHVEQAKIESIKIINDNTTLEEGEKADKIVEAHSYIEGQFKPWGYSFSTLLEGLITSFVISVLMAAFIAKNMMYQDQT
ncbi:MAG: DUF4199 domain-containing protein [Bacteroidia bacterium]